MNHVQKQLPMKYSFIEIIKESALLKLIMLIADGFKKIIINQLDESAIINFIFKKGNEDKNIKDYR